MGVDGCLWLDSDDSGVAVFDGWLESRSDTQKKRTHVHTQTRNAREVHFTKFPDCHLNPHSYESSP